MNINFLQYSGHERSVTDWKKKLNLENKKNKAESPILPFAFKIYLKSKKGTQDMYKLLNKSTELTSGRIAWDKKYTFNNNEWKTTFNEPFRITKDTTMQWFQTRINHKILATNKFSYKMLQMTQNVSSALYQMKLLSISYGSAILSKDFYMKLLTG